MRISRLLSGQDTTTTAGTPDLKLLQPLDGRDVPASYRRGRCHEEHAGQQRQDEDEPLGIHGKSSDVWVEVSEGKGRGRASRCHSPKNPFFISAHCTIPPMWRAFFGRDRSRGGCHWRTNRVFFDLVPEARV